MINTCFANHVVKEEDYEIIKSIGSGGYGEVFLAKNKQNDFVAIKMVPFSNLDQELVLREMSILCTMKHPAILKIQGFYIKDDDTDFETKYCHMVLDYMENGTLFEALKKADEDDNEEEETNLDNWTPTRISMIIYGVAHAMSYLHRRKVVHRDLKPDNVFLNKENKPFLADMGLSKFITSHKSNLENTIGLGTPMYMAPELISNEYDQKVDVYSFSILLLQLFVLKPEFDMSMFTNMKPPQSPYEILNFYTHGGRFIIPDTVPDNFANLIRNCWDSDPEKRPTFFQITKEIESGIVFPGTNQKIFMEYVKDLNSSLESSLIFDLMEEEDCSYSFV